MREMMEHSTPLATEDPKEAIWDLNPFDVQTLQQSTATSRIRTSVELPATAMAHSTYRYNLLRSYHAISASRNAKVLATWVQHREKFFDGSLWYLGGEKQGQTQLAPVFHPEEVGAPQHRPRSSMLLSRWEGCEPRKKMLRE